MEILIRESPEACAALAARVVRRTVGSEREPVLGLATGGTPLLLYRELVELHRRGELSFQSTTTFNLDEYVGLAQSDPHSYHHYMRQHFFDHVDLDPQRTHLPQGNAPDLRQACRDYEELIRSAGGIDLQILGIGANGHIGFNEPTCSLASRTWVKILSEQTIRDNARFFAEESEVPRHVVTVGIATILEARHCLLLATGPKKADAVQRMIEGPVSAMCPASALQLHPRVTVVLDEEAAFLLSFKEHYRWVEAHKLDWQRID